MYFTLWKSERDNQWYFILVAKNGETIAQSEGYTRKENALKGIKAVKRCLFAKVREL